MTELDLILETACSVTRCSPQQARSRDKQQKCTFARFIFFAIATENGSRDYVATWHLGRNRSISFHYRKRVEDLSMSDKEFNSLLIKARKKYAGINQPV